MNIKKDWKEITLREWRELNSIQSDNELTTLIERISILADADPADIRTLPLKKFNSLVTEMEWLNKEVPNDIVLRFELEGKRYGMIPDLNFITTGEFIDAENFKKDPIDNIHYLCALLWRPIIWEEGDDWKIQPHIPQGFEKRANLFLDKLPITYVWGALLFFSSIGIQFTEILADFLKVDQKAQKKNQKTQSPLKKRKSKSSKTNGPGIQ
jgi:hypothetical protein